MEIKVNVKVLVVDPISKTPVLILEEPNSKKIVPIWIGVFEANAIALKLENIETSRPMTHDLLKNFLERLGVSVEKVVVTKIVDNAFHADIHAKKPDGEVVVIDSRSSDAIALALRANAPIYVKDKVVEEAHSLGPDENLEDSEKLKKWLENLKPESFGKYKM